ncbi:MAG: DUF444 family protein, partial [Candidatus Nanohaloarchaea archaeon]|nr:DUF444 family protein [Candidatus Nanohaloarchaea archaeon]
EKQGQGQGEGDGDEEGEGDEPGEGGETRPDYYEMDPEEFAEELDEELGLDLDPKGKKVKELVEGDYNDRSTTGPRGTMDMEQSFRNAAKRELALAEDEEYIKEALKIKGLEPEDVANLLATEKNVQYSTDWFREKAEEIDEDEKGKWDSFEQLDAVMDYEPELELGGGDGSGISLEDDDILYKYPEIIKEYEKQAVIVNIRDVSGSMGEEKRDLVERVMTPMDWYLQGKYENAEFIYICHNNEAWEEDRKDFFGIQSGGSTTISAAYELAEEILEEDYPFDEWNRYVFAAGDGENHGNDTQENVIPLMEEIDANLHAYIETQPGGGNRHANHGDDVEEYFDDQDDVVVTRVNTKNDVIPAIYEILSAEQ